MTGEYFAAPDPQAQSEPGSYHRLLAGAGANLAEGIVTRPIAGRTAMLTYVEWDRGGVAPDHAHPEEQIMLVLEGEVEFTVGGDTRTMGPGDVVVIPALATHGGRGLAERSIVVESFSPPRAHLLELSLPAPPM